MNANQHAPALPTPKNVTGLADLVGAKVARPVHVFDVPSRITMVCGVRKVGLVELTAGEELMASKRVSAGGSPVEKATTLQYELVKESFRQVDGKPVSTADGTVDVIFNAPTTAMLRGLLVAAYQKIHSPEAEDVESFLGSHQVQVG